MMPFRKIRPVAQWIWDKIPSDQRLAVEAKLFGESHSIAMGEYDATLEVISGQLRGRIQHREGHWPQLAEDGLLAKLPEALHTQYQGRLKSGTLKITDVIDIPGLPDLPVLEIDKVDDLTWFMFEYKETIMRAA